MKPWQVFWLTDRPGPARLPVMYHDSDMLAGQSPLTASAQRYGFTPYSLFIALSNREKKEAKGDTVVCICTSRTIIPGLFEKNQKNFQGF